MAKSNDRCKLHAVKRADTGVCVFCISWVFFKLQIKYEMDHP
jgi:hypothetical protein